MNAEDPTNDALAPVAERTISDVEELKAISDPIRLRILEAMVAHADEVWTVKRIAKALDVGPTKLYHHVNILEEHGFIRVAGTRVVSGIIETSYRIAQMSVRLDRGMMSASHASGASGVHDVLSVVFDTAREDIERALISGLIDGTNDPLRQLLVRGLTRLSPERAHELRERMIALVEEFGATPDTADADPDAQPFGYLISLYPMPETAATTENSDD
jgi:DNA-binding transcriptional ArsR family regulator